MKGQILNVLVLLIVVSASQAEDIFFVSLNGTPGNCTIRQPCGSLQQVVDAYESSGSSSPIIIQMSNGTYSGSENYNIVLPNVPVTINAYSFPVDIGICDNSSSSFIFQTSNDLTIAGISLINCGVAINSTNPSSLTTFDTVILDSMDMFGFYGYGDGVFLNGIVSNMEYGMYLFGGNWNISFVIIASVDTCIYGNSNDASSLYLYGTSLTQANTGIHYEGNVSVTIIDSNADEILGNAIYVTTEGSITITGSSVDAETTQNVDTIHLSSNDINISNSTFSSSSAFSFFGVGIIDNCIFENNLGPINFYDYYFYVSNSVIQNSSKGANVNSYAITIDNTFFSGISSTALTIPNPSSVFIQNSVFSSNTGTNGGAIYATGNLNIKNTMFNDNNANYGGAINIPEFNTISTLFENVTFNYNQAIDGAAVYCGASKAVPIITPNNSSLVLVGNLNSGNSGTDIACTVEYGTISTYYIQSGKSSTNCTYEHPCGSIKEAINAIGNTNDFVTLKIFGGNYTSEDNSMIDFPFTTSIQVIGSAPLEIDCAGAEYAFKSSYGLNIYGGTYGSSLNNCGTGIIVDSDNLVIERLFFYNMETGIDFAGQKISTNLCGFYSSNTGVLITNTTSITMNNCDFMTCTNKSININTPNGIVNSIDMSLLKLTNTAGVFVITSNDNDFQIDGVFTNITTSPAVEFINGKWDFGYSSFSNCNDAIHFTGTSDSELSLYKPIIEYCDNGIYFDSPGSFRITNYGTFESIGTAVEVYQSKSIILSAEFTNVDTPILVDTPGTISISDSQITESGRSSITTSSMDSSVLEIRSTGNMGGFTIVGGVWDIESTFTDISFGGNGGALTLYGNSGSIFNFQDSRFTNTISTGNGGAIYSENGSVIIDSCIFSYCEANNGGGLYSIGNNITITNYGSFINCTSSNGGAIYASNSTVFNADGINCINNTATNYGGCIYFEETNPLNATLFDSSFTSNSAMNGAAISCCGNNTSCNVTIVEPNNTVTLQDNHNLQSGGNDITCTVDQQEQQTNYTPPVDNGDGTNDDGAPIGLIVTLSVLVIIVILIILGSGAGYFVYKKKQNSGYDAIN